MELLKFTELEDKIKSLIEGYALLKEKNLQLEESLQKKEGELTAANGEIRRLHEEKNVVRAKVDSLLGIMQDIGVSK